MTQPLGNDPIEINGIEMRWHDEVPSGKYMAYDRDGALLGLGQIAGAWYIDSEGNRVQKLRAPIARMTLNRFDYEIVVVTEKRNKDRIRRYKETGKWFS